MHRTPLVVFGAEVIDDRRDVLRPLPQRRYLDPHDVEPIEQVGTETAFRDLVVQPFIAGGHYPDIDRVPAQRKQETSIVCERSVTSAMMSCDGHE
ncbi:hypothetical protein WT54_02920 [Burkholderia territorii]|nr:hypothetical protein WT37_03715 [Burkholderia territorii]KWE78610.1 hypothetical protein WT54_02920 [Burkholderia territorii]